MKKRRVVVTGIGVKSSIGNDVEDFFDSLKNGRHGIKPISFIDGSKLDVKVASYDYEFDPLEYFEKKEVKRMDRFSQFAVAAAKDALKGQDVLSYHDPYRVGVIFSSGIGGIGTIEKEHQNMLQNGEKAVSVFFIPAMISFKVSCRAKPMMVATIPKPVRIEKTFTPCNLNMITTAITITRYCATENNTPIKLLRCCSSLPV